MVGNHPKIIMTQAGESSALDQPHCFLKLDSRSLSLLMLGGWSVSPKYLNSIPAYVSCIYFTKYV